MLFRSTYATNDIFTVVAQDSGVYWYKNGVQIGFNNLISGTSSLKFRTALYTQNDVIDLISFGYALEGATGSTGATGYSGATGFTGSTGASGSTGSKLFGSVNEP